MSVLEDKIAVVVPTYWTRAGGQAHSGDAVYDHPTPIDELGTLGRLLESLCTLDTRTFYVVVIVAVTDLSVARPAADQVKSIRDQYPRLSTRIVDEETVADIHRLLATDGYSALFGLQEYSRVRNLQLLVPLAVGAKAIVALDDDEVVTDLRFLETALQGLGGVLNGHEVAGSSGYYLQDSRGEIDLSVPAGSEMAGNIFDRKAAIMNEGTARLEAMPGALVPTPFCFGGNMVFTPDLAASVCFDPAITRGEDIDYLINARLAGRWFFMNKHLRILHLPPAGGSYQDVAYHKVVQDVLRFVYEREKLRAWREIGAVERVTPEDLNPYPGLFLGDDLDGAAEEVIARVIASTDEAQRAVLGVGGSVPDFVEGAKVRAHEGVGRYREHQDAWATLARRVMGNHDLRDILSPTSSSWVGATA